MNRQFLGRLEGSMAAEHTSSYTSLWDRQVPGSHRSRSTACQSETLPWITKEGGKGRNFESSGRGLEGSSRNIPFNSCVCSVQVCGWPVYETLGLETSLSSGFFFQGHQAGLGAVDPIFDSLEHCGHRKIQLSYPWRSDLRP